MATVEIFGALRAGVLLAAPHVAGAVIAQQRRVRAAAVGTSGSASKVAH